MFISGENSVSIDSAEQRAHERDRLRVRALEKLLEEQSREIFLANEQMTETASRLQAIQRAIPSMLMVVADDGKIINANEAAAETIGAASHEIESRYIGDIIPAIKLDEIQNNEAASSRQEMMWHAWGGEFIPIRTSVATTHLGDQLTYIVVGEDLRDEQRLELELRQAQRLDSMGQLASGLAHEINNPLQFIGDNVEFLEESLAQLSLVVANAVTVIETGDTDSLTRSVEGIQEEGLIELLPDIFVRTRAGISRVSAIVKAMRELAHPGMGHTEYVEVAKLVESAITVSASSTRDGIEVSSEIEEGLELECYASDVLRILVNLLVNSAQAISMQENDDVQRGRILICAWSMGMDTFLSVEDDGPGIEPDHLDRIFDPFFTTKPVGMGTGQGLAMVKATMHRHGGTIVVESEPGHGVSFTLRFPTQVMIER